MNLIKPAGFVYYLGSDCRMVLNLTIWNTLYLKIKNNLYSVFLFWASLIRLFKHLQRSFWNKWVIWFVHCLLHVSAALVLIACGYWQYVQNMIHNQNFVILKKQNFVILKKQNMTGNFVTTYIIKCFCSSFTVDLR